MGLTDILFGRKKLKGPAEERLFALSTAAVTLQTDLNLTTAGVAGVVFKPLSAGEFVRVENEMEELVQAVAQSSGAKLDRKRSEEHTSELQSLAYLVCRLLLEKKKKE